LANSGYTRTFDHPTAISVVGDEDLFGYCGGCLFVIDHHGRWRPVTDVVHIDLHVIRYDTLLMMSQSVTLDVEVNRCTVQFLISSPTSLPGKE